MDKTYVLDELRKRGASKALVSFSGGNDEGGVDNITLSLKLANGTETEQELEVWGSKGTDDEKLVSELSAAVYDRYYSFAGEFYVNGDVVVDVEEGTVTMSTSEEVPTWENNTYEL